MADAGAAGLAAELGCAGAEREPAPACGRNCQTKKENKDQQKENPQYQQSPKDSQKQKIQSQKLSDEDAERVMQELKNRERDVQDRLNKKIGQTRANQKDW